MRQILDLRHVNQYLETQDKIRRLESWFIIYSERCIFEGSVNIYRATYLDLRLDIVLFHSHLLMTYSVYPLAVAYMSNVYNQAKSHSNLVLVHSALKWYHSLQSSVHRKPL